MKFIDHVKIKVKAGDGGHGCIAFHREKFMPKGGPSGGDGGHGGDIILKSNKQLSTLQDISFNRFYKAERGQHGRGKNMHGRNGKSITIQVPLGTIAIDVESNQILCELTKENQSKVIVNGGNGGFGNARFKTQKNTAPRTANDGQVGEERIVDLELKIMADVGLVGFPNVGKSTLLSTISAAKPKIADYPFTTLIPNLGIVKYGDFNSFVMADIPGLIKGASSGKGLGIQFLRHIERTKLLLILLDGTSFDIESDLKILENELKNHEVDLSNKPKLIFVSKNDILEDNKIIKLLQKRNIISFSAITGNNIDIVIKKIVENLEKFNFSKKTTAKKI
ncbi:MAG: GTPase ObgE [Candidatus Marinimicrobia bacterium]|nr:GTPase ObgE [Candidatus Neomarinimicrobiota bacterium]